jgi:hypothetical protein
LHLAQLSYDPETGDLRRPLLSHDRASEDALAGYLDAARLRFDAAAAWTESTPHRGGLSQEFEHLRWFELPEASLVG